MTATELLDLQRFDVERLLTDCRSLFGDRLPPCPSQSHRALRAITLLQRRLAIGETPEEQAGLLHVPDRLQRFLAVHQQPRLKH